MTEATAAASAATKKEQRKVGAGLGIGILLLPVVFSWFLLKSGYSVLARVLSFGWLAFWVLFAIGSGSTNSPTVASAPNQVTQPVAPATGAATSPEEGANLTGPQKNAVRSAKQYLSFAGFSRNGLIEQLSSSAGDGYDKADATAAVDSLSVDWNENAVKSAKQYLSISGFSCDGLIQQLSSSAGDKYTVSQATYGAKKAGAC